MAPPTALASNKVMPSQSPVVNGVIHLNPAKITVSRAAFWKGRLRLDFNFHPRWLQQIKQLEGRRWHVDHKCWTVPHAPMTVTNLQKLFGDILDMKMEVTPQSFSLTGLQVIKPLRAEKKYEVKVPPKHKGEITRMEEKMMIKRMSFHTIKSYKNHFCHFIFYYNDIAPPDISNQQIVDYILFRIKTQNISESEQNSIISAIKFYYERTLGRDRTFYDIQRPKKPFQLPNVLSEEEVIRLLKATENIKHKCILLTIYSAGLRLSELIKLRKQDLLLDQKMIFVKDGKGKKDRYTLLSDKLLSHLRIYYEHYKPTYWLFEGQEGGQYSNRSVQQILRKAVEKSGVNPLATLRQAQGGAVHTLRHSFATHLICKGVSLRHIQELLGHESSKTTEVYTHLTGDQLREVKSPLEGLDI